MEGSIEGDGWTLQTAAELQLPAQAPGGGPRAGALVVGSRVELAFVFELADGSVEGERLPVRILARHQDGGFRGRLEESPVTSDALARGAEIDFHLAHVTALLG